MLRRVSRTFAKGQHFEVLEVQGERPRPRAGGTCNHWRAGTRPVTHVRPGPGARLCCRLVRRRRDGSDIGEDISGHVRRRWRAFGSALWRRA